MKKLFCFCGMFCFLYFGAVLFEIITRKYFFIGGRMVDFSLWAWGGICFLWGAGLWRLYKGQSKLFEFVCFFSLTCAAFILWQSYLLTENEEYGKYLRFLLMAEAAAVLLAVFLRRGFSVFLSISALGLALCAPYLISAKVFPLSYILTAVGNVSALWLVFLITGNEKIKRLLSGVGLTLLAGGIISAGVVMYLRVPGIRFYEAKITEPAKEVKVSIVIPVYNAEEVIERCLDSLRRQTLKDIEIIAVDDGSTDNTPKILAEYAAHDARIKVIRQENAYVGAARNRGLRAARGEYVGFVDSDDWVSEDYYQTLYDTAKKHNQDVAMVRNVREAWQEASFLQREQGENFEFTESVKDYLLKMRMQYSGYVWNKICRRDFLIDNNIFFTTYRTTYEDAYFSILLLTYIDDMAFTEKGTYYHTVKERETVSSAKAKIEDEIFEMLLKLEHDLKTAKVDEPHRQKGMEIFLFSREKLLQNFYTFLEDKTKFFERCAVVLAEDVCKEAMRGKEEKRNFTAVKLIESVSSQ